VRELETELAPETAPTAPASPRPAQGELF
jgi:hypothetical protein